MKNIIYVLLFLTLPISMAGKDTTTIKADSPAVTQAAKQEEPKTPYAPSIVKHDTVYVAVKEMPGDPTLYISIVATALTLAALWFSIRYSRKAIETSQQAIEASKIANKISDDTLKEMKEQRLVAYKPIINISSQNFILSKEGTEVTYGYIEKPDFSVPPIICDNVPIKLINVGMGAAKNISINWEFDNTSLNEFFDTIIDKEFEYMSKKVAVKHLKTYSEKMEVAIKRFPDRYAQLDVNGQIFDNEVTARTEICEFVYSGKTFILIIRTLNRPNGSVQYNYFIKRGIHKITSPSIDFLVKGENKSINIPSFYFRLYQLCINEINNTEKLINYTYPPLVLKLQYADIQGNPYTSTYYLRLKKVAGIADTTNANTYKQIMFEIVFDINELECIQV